MARHFRLLWFLIYNNFGLSRRLLLGPSWLEQASGRRAIVIVIIVMIIVADGQSGTKRAAASGRRRPRSCSWADWLAAKE